MAENTTTRFPGEVVTFPAGTPAPATLVGAIAAVMTEVHTVAKRGINEFHRYQYATMGDILKEITPLLGRHGLVIFQSETGRAMFDEDNVIAIEYAFTVAHVSGERWPETLRQTGVSTCRNSKGGWDDKSLNKCHTAARKYFLLALFQIPTGDEDDADRGEIEGRRAAVQLKRALPQYVVEPPQRRIDRSLSKQRHIGAQYEAQIKAERRPDTKFRQPIVQPDPPPHDDIPERYR